MTCVCKYVSHTYMGMSMCVRCKCKRKSHYFHEQFSNNNHCHNHCNHGRLWPIQTRTIQYTSYSVSEPKGSFIYELPDECKKFIWKSIETASMGFYWASLRHGSWSKWNQRQLQHLFSLRVHSIVNADCCAYVPLPICHFTLIEDFCALHFLRGG